jgi:predicted secreted Zn-dependent protease
VRETLYYDVAGASADELRTQLDLQSEIEQGDAYTDWQIQWRYDYARSADGCGLVSLTVSLDVTLTFPRWTPPESAAPHRPSVPVGELQEQWRAYLAALEVHEQGHEKLAAQAADEIVTALSSLPLYPSCAELERAADEAGERILEHYRQLELEYDRETEHGATQGARFP